jgi:hypothetical protein
VFQLAEVVRNRGGIIADTGYKSEASDENSGHPS